VHGQHTTARLGRGWLGAVLMTSVPVRGGAGGDRQHARTCSSTWPDLPR